MEEVIKKIVKQEFDVEVATIKEIIDRGLNNLVFYITTGKDSLILRMKKSQSELATYQKEKWCAEVAKKAGVPTPEILKVGVYGEYSFSIQEYIDGVDGNDSEDKARIWNTLGQYAKTINSIPVNDLTFDYSTLHEQLFAEDFFVTKDIFSLEDSSKIKERLGETTKWKFSPKLCHKNLNPSNVVLNKEGVVYLIDWENAAGDHTPLSELGEIYTWNTGKENILQFLAGYGLKETEVKVMMRDIQTLVLLRLVGMIHRKVTGNKDWRQDVFIQNTATMISEIQNYQDNILFTKNL